VQGEEGLRQVYTGNKLVVAVLWRGIQQANIMLMQLFSQTCVIVWGGHGANPWMENYIIIVYEHGDAAEPWGYVLWAAWRESVPWKKTGVTSSSCLCWPERRSGRNGNVAACLVVCLFLKVSNWLMNWQI
jgi:hypothetical protein